MMVKLRQYAGWRLALLAILAIGLAMISPYVRLNPAQSGVELDSSFSLHYALLTTHIFLAFIALVIGDTTLGTAVWLAMVLNLLVAEWLILQRVQRTEKSRAI